MVPRPPPSPSRLHTTPSAQPQPDSLIGGGCLARPPRASFERQSIAISPVDDRRLKREDVAACSKLNCPVSDAPSFSRHLYTWEKQSAGKR